jgi:hypothetical protein
MVGWLLVCSCWDGVLLLMGDLVALPGDRLGMNGQEKNGKRPLAALKEDKNMRI